MSESRQDFFAKLESVRNELQVFKLSRRSAAARPCGLQHSFPAHQIRKLQRLCWHSIAMLRFGEKKVRYASGDEVVWNDAVMEKYRSVEGDSVLNCGALTLLSLSIMSF